MRTPKLKSAMAIGGFALLHFLVYVSLLIVFGANEFRNVFGFQPTPNVFFQGLTEVLAYPLFAPIVDRLILRHEIGFGVISGLCALNSLLWGLAGWAIFKRIKTKTHVNA